MDEEETKLCTNCKREIPAVNFRIHSVHCERNIKICPVCKEPVPGSELDSHHELLHKLLPCKQCGESVCGTDLEDHIRDSCANTVKTCRYCELDLPRRELPAHEGYCGVRTEQCAECGEYVMIKYRQLHLDSNHGFIRLDDDPPPIKKEPKCNIPPTRNVPCISNGGVHTRMQTRSMLNNVGDPNPPRTSSNISVKEAKFNKLQDQNRANVSTAPGPSRPQNNGTKKRTNDQPQINTNTAGTKKIDKDLGVSRGAVKKRVAPAPPRDPRREHAYSAARARQQREERDRLLRNQYNAAHGLPPVLDPLAKLEKLRKMDALANGEQYRPPRRKIDKPQNYDDEQRRQEFQARLVKSVAQSQKNKIPPEHKTRAMKAPANENPKNVPKATKNMKTSQRTKFGKDEDALFAEEIAATLRKLDNSTKATVKQQISSIFETVTGDPMVVNEDSDSDHLLRKWNLKPMSPEQFMARFSELQLGPVAPPAPAPAPAGDRFTQIKSSLRELRRGLNEVTAPYNANNNNNNNNNERNRTPSPRHVSEERLPCEFCEMLLLPQDLVQHQTGCRPDLAQLGAGAGARRSPSPLLRRPPSPRRPSPSPRRSPSPRAPLAPADPVIPCEFCAERLPVYLINEHQERCAGL